jgi:hypothetical protein
LESRQGYPKEFTQENIEKIVEKIIEKVVLSFGFWGWVGLDWVGG